ncbi:N-acetylmuramoyl-L-alanine amidase [Planococcus antarcticus DSM 14505]|uniref:N-acetylmuramoyl-L-alanine amidase n=1 Tax=Planococcus antarcticus DSM 14505 TaxID=1185653 RepID=A0ABM6D7G2_9BACL|nr:SH3 domain-containing protein [Planococcus antarcticus]ANU11279.1 N-acetylmuramoyl-L-alanine amidase [Planococcus antarcticus DSM 14505]
MKRKGLTAFILFVLFIAGSFPLLDKDHVSADNGTVEISGSMVNVRSGPGLSYSVTGDLEQGQTASVISKQGDWLEVRFDGQEGWIASWLTTPSGEEQTASGQTAVSSVNGLNVRAQADLSAAVLTKMNAGEKAKVISTTDGWIEIDFRNTRGFVSKQYISLAEGASETEQPTDETEPVQKKDAISKVSSFEIAVSALNVRSKPDLSSEIQLMVNKGQVFPVVSTQGNWVEIELAEDKKGWAYAFHGQLSDQTAETVENDTKESVTILTDGTNLRTAASTASEVASRADAGEKLAVTGKQGEWYQVSLPDGQTAFVAEWVVSSEEANVEKEQTDLPARKKGTLNGVTIVLDPGHGGNDGGTVGVRKTEEKELTLKTAEILSHHLNAAGAKVVMTRQSDTYVDLRKRVAGSHQAGADAFISIHYDATEDSNVSGFTSYYQHDYQKKLAESLNTGLGDKLTLHDRGVQHGNYLVLRENKQPAVLVELGFLSNFNEERVLTSNQFREQAALGLYTGIINYFDAQLSE